MGKYEQDARQLLEYVGGKENIAAVSHCVSRMRFVLNDPAKADVAKIEALKSAKGTFTQAGQFQVIIGNTVNDFYNDFIAVSGINGVSKEAVKSAAKQNQNALQKVMSVLAEIFAPLIPAIITGGLILGFRNCIDDAIINTIIKSRIAFATNVKWPPMPSTPPAMIVNAAGSAFRWSAGSPGPGGYPPRRGPPAGLWKGQSLKYMT